MPGMSECLHHAKLKAGGLSVALAVHVELPPPHVGVRLLVEAATPLRPPSYRAFRALERATEDIGMSSHVPQQGQAPTEMSPF